MNNVPAAVCRRFYKILSFKGVYLDFYLSLRNLVTKAGKNMVQLTNCLSKARLFTKACINSFFAATIRVFSSAVGVGPSVAAMRAACSAGQA